MELRSKLSLGLAVLTFVASSALSAPNLVVPPQGLSLCSEGSPTALVVAKIASKFGTASGCFVSRETYQQKITSDSILQPLEYAFAITIHHTQAGPFTTANVDQLFSTTSAQWKGVDALWRQDGANYEKRLKQMFQIPSDQHISVKQPLLISMKRLDRNSYVVVSVRKRIIATAGNSFTSTKAEGAAIVLRGGNLIRLSIARELRSKSDVDVVERTIASWARDVEAAQP